jgi:hypothetical protein
MAFEWDPVVFVNLLLCIAIVILGYVCSARSGEKLPLFIAAAFGLFGISHLTALVGLSPVLVIPLILIRTLAYLLVIFALYRFLKDSLAAKETRQAWVDYYKEDLKKEEK